MSLVASFYFIKIGIPADAVNLITQYASTQKWMSVFTEKGVVRRVCPIGFTNVNALFHFKLHAMRNVVPHPIVYNGLYVFQNALTFEQPWFSKEEQVQTETGYETESSLTRRFYTKVEVAENIYEYILHQIKYVRGVDTGKGESLVYRPYTSDKYGQSQLLVSQQVSLGQQTDIRFADWYGGWIWTQQGIMDFATAIPQDEPDEIDWMEDDDNAEIEWAADNIEPEVFEWANGDDDDYEPRIPEWYEGRMETREDADGNLFWEIVV